MNEHQDREMNDRLDSLGAAERAAADETFEGSVSDEAGSLAALTARLDALADSERTGAPAEFEERVIDAVGEVFAPTPVRLTRSHWAGIASGLGLAAAVAIVGGVWLAQQSEPAPVDPFDYELVTFEQDVDMLLELYETDAWDGELAEVVSEAERVEDALDAPWSAYDEVAGSFETGAS